MLNPKNYVSGKACDHYNRFKEDFDTAFQQYDVLITPVAPTTAFKLGEVVNPLQMYLSDIFTLPVKLAGIPGMTIPRHDYRFPVCQGINSMSTVRISFPVRSYKHF